MEQRAIVDISGIGPATAEALGKHDITTLAGLASSSVEKITAVSGFSEARSVRVLAAAAELLAASGATPSAKGKGKGKKSGKKEKSAGKGKKGMKGKKGKKKSKRRGNGKKRKK